MLSKIQEESPGDDVMLIRLSEELSFGSIRRAFLGGS